MKTSARANHYLLLQLAIIDVRDSDHVGGHIKSSKHVPSVTLATATPELVRNLRKTERVVFHCALSQERGPSAALRYMRERERLLGAGSLKFNAQFPVAEERERDAEGNVVQQEVYVLEGGFNKWQERYGEDEKVTEGYQKDIWR